MSHGAKGDTQSPLGPWPLQGPGWQAHPPKKDRGSWTDWGGGVLGVESRSPLLSV